MVFGGVTRMKSRADAALPLRNVAGHIVVYKSGVPRKASQLGDQDMVYKGCQRCGGDLFEEEFLDSRDLVCLQCGGRQAITVSSDRENDIRLTRWLVSARPSRAA